MPGPRRRLPGVKAEEEGRELRVSVVPLMDSPDGRAAVGGAASTLLGWTARVVPGVGATAARVEGVDMVCATLSTALPVPGV